jgi:hypothetical protein
MSSLLKYFTPGHSKCYFLIYSTVVDHLFLSNVPFHASTEYFEPRKGAQFCACAGSLPSSCLGADDAAVALKDEATPSVDDARDC